MQHYALCTLSQFKHELRTVDLTGKHFIFMFRIKNKLSFEGGGGVGSIQKLKALAAFSEQFYA
jgi:hypothetical protein